MSHDCGIQMQSLSRQSRPQVDMHWPMLPTLNKISIWFENAGTRAWAHVPNLMANLTINKNH